MISSHQKFSISCGGRRASCSSARPVTVPPAVRARRAATARLRACRRGGCRAAGIPVAVIPGVTSAQGAAASLLVSLTQRSLIKRIQFVIGHDRAEALPPDLNWPAIADLAATTAIYMPTRTLAAFLRKAIEHGLPPHIPAVAICQATRADQHVETGTAATLAERVAVRVQPAQPSCSSGKLRAIFCKRQSLKVSPLCSGIVSTS
jgi:Tetrapyrrole (Corrin/Porphyrin) Methylases